MNEKRSYWASLDFVRDTPNEIYVTPQTAFRSSPIWQAIDLISADMSRMPLNTYKERSDGGRDLAKTHRVYRMLRRNVGDMTSNLWISRMMGNALIYGNAYSIVNYRDGRVWSLEWRHHDSVQPVKENGRIYYLVKYDLNQDGRGGVERVPRERMVHVVGLTLEEWGGMSLIDYARESFGRLKGAENYSTDFYGNNASPAGLITHEEDLGPDNRRNLVESFEGRHKGGGKQHRTGVLDNNAKYQQIGVNPKDAMHIDQLKQSTREIAAWFNVPPHKLGDDSRTAYNSIEEENNAYEDNTLGKWESRIECETTDKLFSDRELAYVTKFDTSVINQGSRTARMQNHALAITHGIMSPNEVRLREGLNPYDGGDEYWRPANMTTPSDEDEATDEAASESTDEPAPDARALIAVRDAFAERLDACGQMLWRSAIKAAKRCDYKRTNGEPDEFLAELSEIGVQCAPIMEAKLQATAAAVEALTGTNPTADSIELLFQRMQSMFLDAYDSGDIVERCRAIGESVRTIAHPIADSRVISSEVMS